MWFYRLNPQKDFRALLQGMCALCMRMLGLSATSCFAGSILLHVSRPCMNFLPPLLCLLEAESERGAGEDMKVNKPMCYMTC